MGHTGSLWWLCSHTVQELHGEMEKNHTTSRGDTGTKLFWPQVGGGVEGKFVREHHLCAPDDACQFLFGAKRACIGQMVGFDRAWGQCSCICILAPQLVTLTVLIGVAGRQRRGGGGVLQERVEWGFTTDLQV
mgnify:CR=1 FL=1